MENLRPHIHGGKADFPQKAEGCPKMHEGCFFTWVNPRDPKGVERRLGDLYWNGWSALVFGLGLTTVGLTMFLIAGVCLYSLGDVQRACGLLFISVLCGLPGVYSLFVLWYFVCGKRGYSYEQLLTN
uniref:Transmembrane protein 230 n=1 Tax=Trypanosoma congolense (strain IL3000) TaxID=1068625 RepID=G0UNY3_TRYCI|nr:conserved hypothetical protein [Trypanosoma congolense IL3000]